MNFGRNLLIIILPILMSSCNKGDIPNPDGSTGNSSFLVHPKLTDPAYSIGDESHFVITNTKVRNNRLLLFIGGSYSTPKEHFIFCEHAASMGFDVISLSYPNGVATASLGVSSDSLIFDHYRQELCFGTPLSNVVSVDSLNSISTRAVKLIQFLKATYPNQNWDQYLNTFNSLSWDRIVVAGHSQGSGHACYLAKKKLMERVLMFSGPNDYSSNFTTPANWLKQSGVTPITRHLALLHMQDEIVSFSNQISNLQALGLLKLGQVPTQVDHVLSPFGSSTALSINIDAISYHSSTVGGHPKLADIWTYMLTTDLKK
jgi:hypothetical protein